MPAMSLDHVNIRTTLCEETKDFFVDVVGLRVGERPSFNFGGYWLYAGDRAVIHLTDARDPRSNGLAEGRRGAAIDHISFRMTGYRALRELLDQRGLSYQTQIVPRNGDVQVFVDDPNGVNVELTFLGSEVTAEEKAALSSR